MQVRSGSLEAKVLREQGTDEPRIVFGKCIKIKSREFDHLSYQIRIRNKSGLYSKEDIWAPSFLILLG